VEHWYYVSLFYATYAIKVINEVVCETAPISLWMMGKNINYVKEWIKKKDHNSILIEF